MEMMTHTNIRIILDSEVNERILALSFNISVGESCARGYLTEVQIDDKGFVMGEPNAILTKKIEVIYESIITVDDIVTFECLTVK